MKKYYLHNGSSQEGPFSLDELKEKAITQDTPVWYEGLQDWMLAKEDENLKEKFSSKTPPPFKSPFPVIPEPILPSKTTLSTNTPTKKKKRSWAGILITLIIIGGAISAVMYYQIKEREESDKASFRSNPDLYIHLHHNGFNYNKVFGGISNLKFTIKNNSKFYIDNVRVIVSYIRRNGDTYKEVFVDVSNLPAHSQRVIDAPNSNAGMDVSLRIGSVNSSEAGSF